MKRPNLAHLTLASVSQPQAFDIASQPLDRALTVYSAQAHIQVLVAGELTSGLPSSGASGTYTPEEALHRLLEGTGLTYRFLSPDTVTLERFTQRGREDPQLAPATGGEQRAPRGEILPTEPITVAAPLSSRMDSSPISFVQGLANVGFTDLANVERVEVLKGPASALYGLNDPGGLLNIVTKKPLPEPYYAGDFTTGSMTSTDRPWTSPAP